MCKKITTDVSVRFRDVDSMGHVNNSVYFTYFEEGRKKFFYDLFGVETSSGYHFILAHIGCDFKRSVLLRDKVKIQLWIGEIGKKKFDFIYQVVGRDDESIIYAKGKSVQVWYDYEKNESIPIPQDFLETVREYCE